LAGWALASTVLVPIADALAALISGIAGLSGSTTVKGRKWKPPGGDVDSLPVGVVYLPTVERTGVDLAEDHLGANDWEIGFPAILYFTADDIAFGQAQAAEVTEAFIKAVDANPTLGLGIVQETKVTRVDEAEVIELNNRPVIQVRTRVELLSFV
jgi:hypothetical protein